MTPTKRLLALAALASVSLGHCARAQHATEAAQGETITLDAQGGDYPEWFQNPHMVEFYALSVGMLRATPAASTPPLTSNSRTRSSGLSRARWGPTPTA